MCAEQKAIDSPFGMRSTAAEVVAGMDLRGKSVVVTGGYSGIGTETVWALAGGGATVLVGARRVGVAEGNLHPMFKTVEQGASTTVWCATSPLLAGMGGVYCENCNVAEPWQKGNPPMVGVHAHVCDDEVAEALWVKSEALTGVSFSG
ncbi:MAG TPA: hypothetical protein VLL52_10690 [Anaerolineae bacterium]|nr:hypothetical protein [Anaerolineae bacterium]